MRISEVADFTGLTKKAINYYEEEGLIKPEVNRENSYREYSEEDVEKLLRIALLRQMDVPVKDIRDIISSPESLRNKLEEHFMKLGDEVDRIERKRNLISSCLEDLGGPGNDFVNLTGRLHELNNSLSVSERNREGFMKRQLQRAFPGNFGKMLLMYYSPFLGEPVDTPEKERAWQNIVKFLDEAEAIEYPEEMGEMYDKLTDEYMEKYEAMVTKDVKRWLEMTPEDMASERDKVLGTLKEFSGRMKENSSFWKKTLEQIKGLKMKMKYSGYYDVFLQNLKLLSKDFRIYTEKREEFFNTLNLKEGEDGEIII